MKQTVSIFLFIIFVVGYSCNYKREKSNFETITSDISTIDSAKVQTPINKTLMAENIAQKEVFVTLVNAMAINDIDTYKKFIPQMKNIDTLILFTPSGDEDEIYYSLLGLSCRLNCLEAMKDLVLRGADITLGSEDLIYVQDALYYAILGGNAEMVKLLVDKKTDVNVLYTSSGITPLVLASRNEKYLMAEILLKAGAQVNGAGRLDSDYILYPLHEAIAKKDVEMVKLLLKYNADTQLKDADGVDALALAKSLDAKQIVQLLEK